MNQNLSFKLEQLPDSPGIYIMKSQGDIIYIGKAISLKNRVRQYFHPSRSHGPKVEAMVRHIDDFDILLCDGELEALILECNLIKEHRPFYNILLKDDKHYPYIRLDLSAPYPAIQLVRRIEKDGARYFGPYIGATAVREVMDIVRALFPIRSCERDITKKAKRPCLHYQMGRCKAPCMGYITPEEYADLVKQVVAFLNGQKDDILKALNRQMADASAQLQFERAGMLRDQIHAVQEVMQKQKALLVSGDDMDVLSIVSDGVDAVVVALFLRDGKLTGSEQFIMQRVGEEEEEIAEAAAMFLLQYYDSVPVIPPTIIINIAPNDKDTIAQLLSDKRQRKVTLSVPERGEKRKLALMAQKNAMDAAQKRKMHLIRQEDKAVKAAQELADALGLAKIGRIEAFDISNTQGAQSVASMVVFIDGKPAPSQYRHFRIRGVQGPNDFESMREVLTRRLKRYLKESGEGQTQGFAHLPDVILIDGGPQQLAFALNAADEVGVSVPMFGLAKRFEEIYLPDQQEPIFLPRTSEALRLIQRLRDEAHRFAITHHRSLRQKRSVHSQLEDIPGIGPGRRRALLTYFANMQAIRDASMEELLQAPGMTRPSAEAVYSALHT